MDVELIYDVEEIPECTVLHDVKDEGANYSGLWTSMRGSYIVEVPKSACKPYQKPDDSFLNEAAKVAVAFDMVGTTDDKRHITLVGSEDVRNRALERFYLGRKTKAPVGAGNYTPGVKVMLIGERTSHPEKCKFHAPFCSVKASSGWLNKLLCEANIDEKDLFWVNALDNDGTPVDLGTMHAYLKPGVIFALGKVAERQLDSYNLDYVAFAHPQYWKRFRSKQPYPLIDALKELIIS